MEMVKIVHNDYAKISDICMFLSNEYVLKFNVELFKKTNNGTKNYHTEIGYSQDNLYRVNINRQFYYYLTIESIKRSKDSDMKLQIRIGIQDIYFLRFKLNQVVSWFTSEEFKSLFVKGRDGSITMPVKVEPIKCFVAFDNYIEFEPAVQLTQNGDQIIGVNVYLNSDGVSFFMPVNGLLSFYDFISRFNMYQSAQLMVNYIGRPDNGTNYYDMNSGFRTGDYIADDRSRTTTRPSYDGVGFFQRIKAKDSTEDK